MLGLSALLTQTHAVMQGTVVRRAAADTLLLLQVPLQAASKCWSSPHTMPAPDLRPRTCPCPCSNKAGKALQYLGTRVTQGVAQVTTRQNSGGAGTFAHVPDPHGDSEPAAAPMEPTWSPRQSLDGATDGATTTTTNTTTK